MKEGAEVESADEQETVLVSCLPLPPPRSPLTPCLFIRARADHVLLACLSFLCFQTTPSSSAPAVRTKYDRMFEKKNQNILSEHYTSLIDHSSSNDPSALDSTSNDVDDFITLKRANHDIDASSANVPLSSDLSKRKLKAGESRKAALKLKGAPTKLVFDEEGAAHEIYELVGEEEEKGKKKGDEKERFVELEKGKMEEIDVEDRAVAREKRREKRRKEKEREKAVSFGPVTICCFCWSC
jgi:ATP-dependent RNA helicase DDX10/DBP4